MAQEIANLYAKLGVDDSQLQRGLTRADASLNRTAAAMGTADRATSRLGATMSRVAKGSLIGLGFGASLAGAAALKAAYDFDDAMTRIESLVGIAKHEVDAMRASVQDLAITSARSGKEAAEAMYYIQSAGLRGADAMETLDASLKAAAVGLGDTATVADLATSAMNAYKGTTLTATGAVDVLLASVREGKLAPEELAGSMGRVLPIASNLGVQFHEVGAALAAMSRTGTNAAEGVTQLRSIMQAFVKPSVESAKAMAEVGLSADEVRASFQQKGLLKTLQLVTDRFKDNDEAQAIVFGRIRALTGVMDLLGKNTKDTERIFANMESTNGDLARAFDVTSQSAGFKMQEAMAQARKALEGMAEAAIPLLTGLAEGFSGATKALSPFVGALGKVGGALNGVTGGMGMFGIGLGAMAFSLPRVQSAMAGALVTTNRWNGDLRGLMAGMNSSAVVFDRHIKGTAGMAAGMTKAAGAARMLGGSLLRLASPMLIPAIGAAAVGVAATAIPAIIGSFSGAETAASRARREFLDLKGAMDAITGTSAATASAHTSLMDAEDALAASTKKRAEAARLVASTPDGSDARATAVRDLQRANYELIAAEDALVAAKRKVAGADGALVLEADRLTKSLTQTLGVNKKSTAALSNDARVKKQAAQNAELLANHTLTSNKVTIKAQQDAQKLADRLGGMGKEYGKAAQAAQKLADAPTAKEAVDAAAELREELKKVADTGQGDISKEINADLANIGNTGTQMGALYTEVSDYVERIKAKLQQGAEDMKAITSGYPTSASPSNIPTIRSNFGQILSVAEAGLSKVEKAVQGSATRIKGWMAKTGDPVGSWASGPGIRDLLSTAATEGILIPKKAVEADAAAARKVERLRKELDDLGDDATKKEKNRLSKQLQQAVAHARGRRNALQQIVDDHAKAKEAINAALEGTKAQLLGDLDRRFNDYAVGTAQSATIVKGAFSRLQDEVDNALRGVEAVIKGKSSALDKAMRGILIDNLDAVAGQFAGQMREVAAIYNQIESLTDSKNLTASEQAIKDLEATMKAEDAALAESERNAAKTAALEKLATAQRWGNAEAAAEARKELARIEREELAAARQVTLDELRVTAEAEREARDAEAELLQEQMNDKAAAIRDGITEEGRVAREAITASGEARRMVLQQQYDAERAGIEKHVENMRVEMEKVAGVMAAGLGKGRNHAKLFAHSMAGWGNRAGRYFSDNLAKGLRGVSGKIRNILKREVAAYLELHSPAEKGPLSNIDKWWQPMGDTLMKPVDLVPDLSAIKSLPVSVGGGGGSVVINVNVTDQTFAGMSRDQADRVARELQAAMDRQVRITT